MSIVSKFKKFFSIGEVEKEKGAAAAAAAAAAADILLYVVSLALIPAKVQKQRDKIVELKKLPIDEQTALFGEIYSDLKKYLIEESGGKLAAEDIKRRIRENFDLEKIDEKIRVFFLAEEERVFTFNNIILDFFFKYLTDNLGTNRLKEIVDKATKGTVLEQAGFDGKRFYFEFLMRKKISTGDITSAFTKLNNALYQEISGSFGKNKADALVDQMRQFVEKTYAAAAAAAADLPTYLAEISRGLGEEKKEEKAIISVTPQAREMISSIGLGELVAKGLIKNVETELVTKDGKKLPVGASASALKDNAGNITGMVISARDLRELKKYAAERLAKITPVLQKMSMGDFSENVEIPEREDEFTEHLVALNLMVDDLRETVGKNVGLVKALEQEKAGLEQKVKERTRDIDASNQQLKAANQQMNAANQQLAAAQKNLQDKLLELERFNKVAVGRELKMVELKEEIKRLQVLKNQEK